MDNRRKAGWQQAAGALLLLLLCFLPFALREGGGGRSTWTSAIFTTIPARPVTRWKTSWQTSGRASDLRARYEAFLEEHQADYRKLYDRVDVDIGEDLSAGLPTSRRLAYGAEGVDDPSLYGLYLQYSRYLIIAGSRPDS